MASIVTMCDLCAKEKSEMFRLKPVAGKTTTEKRQKCEFCKKSFPGNLLKQYIVSGKGERK